MWARSVEECADIGAGSRRGTRGIEFDQLALDINGSVALLRSAGYGRVPPAVRQHVDLVDDVIDVVDELPVIGAATDIVPSEEDVNYTDWRQAAARGPYVHDWTTRHGPYQRLVSPTKPISPDELPLSTVTVAQLVQIPVGPS